MNDSTDEKGLPKPGRITPKQARALLDRGACLVDVRSPAEYRREHVDGAINIPIHVLSAYFGDLADRDCPVIVYCRTGERSEVAFRVLQQRGLEYVYDGGAYSEWP
jgi:phage shock protein E